MPRIPSVLLLLGAVARVVESANVCTYEGGWSLRIAASTCPLDAPINCGPGIQLRCCPEGLTCAGEGDFGGSWCCKEGVDCKKPASESPKCPDPTWTLWGGNGTLKDGGWCCQPGNNGFYRGKMEAVGCTAAGVRSLPTGYSFASTVATTPCVSPTSSATSTATDSASQTPTSVGATEPDSSSSPSLSGGAIAGIVVGAMCGVALIAGIFGLAWYRKKRARNSASPAAEMEQPPPPQQLDGSDYHSAYHDQSVKSPSQAHGMQDQASELGGVERNELPNNNPTRHEMGNARAHGAYHEME